MSKFIETLKINFEPQNENPENAGKNSRIPEDRIKRQKRRLYFSLLLAVIMVLAASAVYRYMQNGRNDGSVEAVTAPRIVGVLAVDKTAVYSDTVTTVGSVKAGLAVDAVSLTRGTVRNLFFSVGDSVEPGRTLAGLQNDATAVNYANARVNYSNAVSSYEISKLTAEKTVEQARLGAQTAAAAVQSAEIGVKTARDNLDNIGALQTKNDNDIKDQAVISFYDLLNTMNSSLDQIDLAIQADAMVRDRDLEGVLGVKNYALLPAARLDYGSARRLYEELENLDPGRDSVAGAFSRLIAGLEATKQAADSAVSVLNNSITSAIYGENWLNGQKSALAALRGAIVNTLNRTEQIRQTLGSLSLNNQRERDQLENALAAAQKQLDTARLAHENALVGLAAAENGVAQQLNAARSSVDSAQGQVNVLGTLVSDLTIQSPIRGIVTGRYVEVGAEVNPGQRIAQISQLETLAIEVSLPSEQIYRIVPGAEAILQGEYIGRVSRIDPAADPLTKKIRAEITYDNRGRELLPGTFVDVAIPAKELKKSGPDSVFIPLRALNLGQTESYVYTVLGGRAEMKTVVAGKTEGALVEILSGLQDGELLIVDGAKEVADGEAVSIK